MMTKTAHTAPASTLSDQVAALVAEVLTGTPHFLVELDVRGTKGSRVVNVYLDSDIGIGVDDMARISRDLGFLLDTEEVMGGNYSLNISSPGIDRPLRLRRQYKKNIGRTLLVHYRKPEGEGETEATGELVSVDDESIELDMTTKNKKQTQTEQRRIAFDDIVWAKVRLPW
jgi:ribosome maturation factor RimP